MGSFYTSLIESTHDIKENFTIFNFLFPDCDIDNSTSLKIYPENCGLIKFPQRQMNVKLCYLKTTDRLVLHERYKYHFMSINIDAGITENFNTYLSSM